MTQFSACPTGLLFGDDLINIQPKEVNDSVPTKVLDDVLVGVWSVMHVPTLNDSKAIDSVIFYVEHNLPASSNSIADALPYRHGSVELLEPAI